MSKKIENRERGGGGGGEDGILNVIFVTALVLFHKIKHL